MKKLILTGATLFLISGTVLALNSPEPTGADEKPPLVTQVENHEERIGDLEVKTDKTQTQVNQNTADIGGLQANTNTPAADPVDPVHTPVRPPASNPPSDDPDPTPEPEPEPDQWTVTSIVETRPQNARYPDKVDLRCKITFYNGQVGWSISTISETSTTTCSSNYNIAVGQVITTAMRNYLRFDAPPF